MKILLRFNMLIRFYVLSIVVPQVKNL